MYSFKTTK